MGKGEIGKCRNSVVIAKESARQQIENSLLEMKAEIAMARGSYEDEANRLENVLAKERDIPSKVTKHIETAQAGAEIMVKTLRYWTN
jgi:hypothetical protein